MTTGRSDSIIDIAAELSPFTPGWDDCKPGDSLEISEMARGTLVFFLLGILSVLQAQMKGEWLGHAHRVM